MVNYVLTSNPNRDIPTFIGWFVGWKPIITKSSGLCRPSLVLVFSFCLDLPLLEDSANFRGGVAVNGLAHFMIPRESATRPGFPLGSWHCFLDGSSTGALFDSFWICQCRFFHTDKKILIAARSFCDSTNMGIWLGVSPCFVPQRVRHKCFCQNFNLCLWLKYHMKRLYLSTSVVLEEEMSQSWLARRRSCPVIHERRSCQRDVAGIFYKLSDETLVQRPFLRRVTGERSLKRTFERDWLDLEPAFRAWLSQWVDLLKRIFCVNFQEASGDGR